MDLQLHNSKETIAVSDAVFGLEYKESLIHQLVTAYMAAGRAGTVAQKNRSAVRGGGASHGIKKVLDVPVPVLAAAHCGVVVVLHLLLSHVITRRS